MRRTSWLVDGCCGKIAADALGGHENARTVESYYERQLERYNKVQRKAYLAIK